MTKITQRFKCVGAVSLSTLTTAFPAVSNPQPSARRVNLRGSSLGHILKCSSHDIFQSSDGSSKSYLRTKHATAIDISMYAMFLPMQTRPPALNAKLYLCSRSPSEPTHLSGRNRSGSGNISGSRCAT